MLFYQQCWSGITRTSSCINYNSALKWPIRLTYTWISYRQSDSFVMTNFHNVHLSPINCSYMDWAIAQTAFCSVLSFDVIYELKYSNGSQNYEKCSYSDAHDEMKPFAVTYLQLDMPVIFCENSPCDLKSNRKYVSLIVWLKHICWLKASQYWPLQSHIMTALSTCNLMPLLKYFSPEQTKMNCCYHAPWNHFILRVLRVAACSSLKTLVKTTTVDGIETVCLKANICPCSNFIFKITN